MDAFLSNIISYNPAATKWGIGKRLYCRSDCPCVHMHSAVYNTNVFVCQMCLPSGNREPGATFLIANNVRFRNLYTALEDSELISLFEQVDLVVLLRAVFL